jgi:phosphatidylglycerol:prolipoprotein diacylglycerol transferase
MENHLLIDISNGGFLYQIFYVLAFLTAYLVLIYEGYRRKFPLLAWVLLLASVQLAAVVGTKIFSYSLQEWQYMFQNNIFIPNREKSLLGCVLLAGGTFVFAKYLLKFKYPVWDTFAVAFPFAVSVTTIGCFFYGCCFGTSSDLPWAVRYPVMSLAHYHQFESGLLSYNDLYSLPVHPVQLYVTLGGIIVALLVVMFRKRWKANGSLLLSSVILFLIMRFIAEFFRDPLSNKSGGEMLWILKQVQWQYLLFATLMTSLLIFREKSYKPFTSPASTTQPELKKQALFLLTILMIFVLLRNWFRLPEIVALNIALLPAVIFMGVEIYKATASNKYRWVYFCSLLLPLFLMSQTLPQAQIDTAAAKKYKTYHTVGAGYATGSYTDDRMTFTGEGCQMVTNHEYFSQKYKVGGAGYSYTREEPDKQVITTFGANAFLGDYRQIRQSSNNEDKVFLWGISPYVKYDTKWVGIGGGLHLGNLAFTTGDTRKEGSYMLTTGNFKTFIFPQVNLRLGIRRVFFADIHIADQFPASVPGMAFQVGVGSGFGLTNGLNLRAGFSFLDESGFYVSGYFPIENRIVLEPMFLWTSKGEKDLYNIDLPEKQFSIGLSYRFGHK